jgi:hypothetical protein
MLTLVIASSILASIFLVAAVVEQVGRFSVNFLARWRAGSATSAPFESEDHFGLRAEPNQLPTH